MKKLKDINKIVTVAGISLTDKMHPDKSIKATRKIRKLYKSLNWKEKTAFNKKINNNPNAITDLLER